MKNLITKIFIIIILVFAQNAIVHAQNLVPNWSFEDTVACPIGINRVGDAFGWINFRGTPEYFNSCATPLSHVSVPSNSSFGYQCPANGNAYCGLIAYATGLPNWHEFFGIQLSNPLISGQKYYVSFKVSLSDQSLCGCNKLGVLFSSVKLPLDTFGTTTLINFAHIYTNQIIIDTISWTTIHGSFVADSNYKYIIIGNFFDDSSTDTIRLYPITLCSSYYFIDDVCVSIDSLTCEIPKGHNVCDTTVSIFETNLNKETYIIYPNPSNGKILIELPYINEATISIYNLLGQLKWVKIFLDKTIAIDLFGFKSGIYIIQITQNNQIFNKKLIIN